MPIIICFYSTEGQKVYEKQSHPSLSDVSVLRLASTNDPSSLHRMPRPFLPFLGCRSVTQVVRLFLATIAYRNGRYLNRILAEAGYTNCSPLQTQSFRLVLDAA